MAENIKYADSLEVDAGKGLTQTVRITKMRPNDTVRVHGRRIKIKDIPLNAATLNCGHIVHGIAFTVGDVVFCEEHEKDDFVAEILR